MRSASSSSKSVRMPTTSEMAPDMSGRLSRSMVRNALRGVSRVWREVGTGEARERVRREMVARSERRMVKLLLSSELGTQA